MLEIFLIGLMFGLPIFLFTLVLTRKNGKLYYAPMVTFLAGAFVVAYSIFKIGGFEGMGYGILGGSIILISIIGITILPIIQKRRKRKSYTRVDKGILVLSPLILFAAIGWIIIQNDGYWIINKGSAKVITQDYESYYRVSTISEGAKQLDIYLDDQYKGKSIEVKKVKKIGNTRVTITTVDSNQPDQVPFISIGLDKIVEPLEVQTIDGTKINDFSY